MRNILLSFVLLFVAISSALAQELTVKSFKLAGSDLTAQTQPRKDLNNLNCALVKVGIALDGVKFDGSIMGKPIQKLGEYWVYMPKGVSMLQVLHKNYTPLMVNFYDYGVGKVESGMTYILTLSKPAGSTEPTDAGGNFYALTVTPKNAVVTIDGNPQTVSTDGEYSAMLPYGTYVVVEQQPKYAWLKDWKNRHYETDRPKEIDLPAVYADEAGAQASPGVLDPFYRYQASFSAAQLEQRYQIRFLEESRVLQAHSDRGDFEIFPYGLTAASAAPARPTPRLLSCCVR